MPWAVASACARCRDHVASFRETLASAIKDISQHGYDGEARLAVWLKRLKDAAEESLTSEAEMDRALRRSLGSIYRKLVDRGGLEREAGVPLFTIKKVKPKLKAELDRRIMASAQLIKLNRKQAIDDTLQRFAGWSTSIPAGGSQAVDKGQTAADLRKSLSSLSYRERRVLIDQGHKFTSALSEIVAVDHGAIAGIWRSHWRQHNYDYRQDHKLRDEKFYVVRKCWADERGLIKHPNGYTDQITQPGEEVFCRCKYQWIFHLRDLPRAMLTKKGAEELERVRVK